MTIDTGKIGLDDWIFAMRGIDGDRMLTLKTNDGGFHSSSETPGRRGARPDDPRPAERRAQPQRPGRSSPPTRAIVSASC
jgi:hypothetical protein